MKLIAENCPRGDDILLALQADRRLGGAARPPAAQARPRRGLDQGIPSASSTDVPEGASELPASHRTSFPGVNQSRTVVQLLLTVPRDKAVLATTGPYQSYNFLVDGEVLRQGELFETFRYKFNVPLTAQQQPGDQIPLALERNLRAGNYTWIVKLQDLNGNSYYQLREDVDRPQRQHRGSRAAAGRSARRAAAAGRAARVPGRGQRVAAARRWTPIRRSSCGRRTTDSSPARCASRRAPSASASRGSRSTSTASR